MLTVLTGNTYLFEPRLLKFLTERFLQELFANMYAGILPCVFYMPSLRELKSHLYSYGWKACIITTNSS